MYVINVFIIEFTAFRKKYSKQNCLSYILKNTCKVKLKMLHQSQKMSLKQVVVTAQPQPLGLKQLP